MKVSDYIAERLKKETGVVFGYQGSSISHLIDSICEKGIQYVQNYHEQASAFSACGYAESSGNLGVAISCSGPGATNLLTGIANSYYDSLPCLFICGQVSTHEMRDNHARQNGFQETKIIEIVKPITKYCVEVTKAEEIQQELEKCISIAKENRQGPVLLSIPHNLQTSQITLSENDVLSEKKDIALELVEVAKVIEESKRPLLLIGGGARGLFENENFLKFLDYYPIPYVASLKGLNHVVFERNYQGMVGAYGNREANLTVYQCDLLITIGSRMDGRQTGGIRENFAPNAKIIHVDCDKNELNRDVMADYPICCECDCFFSQLLPVLTKNKHEYRDWKSVLKDIKEHSIYDSDNKQATPYNFVEYISNLFINTKVVVSADVGQNQMWVAQKLKMSKDSSFITSGGHGSMGYSLPASVGAWYSSNPELVVSYMGDGGVQMNIQELETLRRENISAAVIVFVNNGLGLIRDYQSKALGGRYNGSVTGFSVPSLNKIAAAYEMEYINADSDFSEITKDKLYGKRTLIEVPVVQDSVIIPELAYKRPIYDQQPFIDLSFLN